MGVWGWKEGGGIKRGDGEREWGWRGGVGRRGGGEREWGWREGVGMEKGSVREREGASIKRLSVSIKQASLVLFNIASFGPYKEKPPELNNSSIHYIHTMIESVVLVLVGEGDRVSMPLW